MKGNRPVDLSFWRPNRSWGGRKERLWSYNAVECTCNLSILLGNPTMLQGEQMQPYTEL